MRFSPIAALVALTLAGCNIEPNPTPTTDFPGYTPPGEADQTGSTDGAPPPPPQDVWSGPTEDVGQAGEPDADNEPAGDAAAEDAETPTPDGDVVEPPSVVPYEPDETTAAIALTGCDETHSVAVLPWDERPSSERTCWANDQPVPCLPWELCDRGLAGCGPGGTMVSGSLKCFSPCQDGACAAGGVCTPIDIDDCDVVHTIDGCQGAADPSAWPTYPDAGAQPSEGGLGCWTTLAEMTGQNSGSRVARVGAHIYLLFWQSGVSVGGGIPIEERTLQVLPFSTEGAPTTPTTLVIGAGADTRWTRLRSSGGRLLVFESPTALEVSTTAVTSMILWGAPAADGSVTLEPSGITVALHHDRGAAVPGTQHGCIVERKAGDLHLICFPVVDGTLQKTSTALKAPKAVEDYLLYYGANVSGGSPISTRTWSVGASESWFAVATGDGCDPKAPRLLHYAPFDSANDAIAGDWSTVPLDDGFATCTSSQQVLLYKDTLVLDGRTTRMSTDGLSPWLAASQRAAGAGYPMDWDIAGDVLLSLDLLTLTGADPPARLSTNRILW